MATNYLARTIPKGLRLNKSIERRRFGIDRIAPT